MTRALPGAGAGPPGSRCAEASRSVSRPCSAPCEQVEPDVVGDDGLVQSRQDGVHERYPLSLRQTVEMRADDRRREVLARVRRAGPARAAARSRRRVKPAASRRARRVSASRSSRARAIRGGPGGRQRRSRPARSRVAGAPHWATSRPPGFSAAYRRANRRSWSAIQWNVAVEMIASTGSSRVSSTRSDANASTRSPSRRASARPSPHCRRRRPPSRWARARQQLGHAAGAAAGVEHALVAAQVEPIDTSRAIASCGSETRS